MFNFMMIYLKDFLFYIYFKVVYKFDLFCYRKLFSKLEIIEEFINRRMD